MDFRSWPTDQPVIAIVGPTASGKTDLSQQIALQLHGEIVSADSMQIYKGMDIGTGKLPVHERLVPHWGFDLVNPGQEYSVALFQEYARGCFSDIASRAQRPVLCGGTGLYVQAALDDFDFPSGGQVDNPIREKYTLFAEEKGNQALWDLLYSVDPASANVLHPNNVRRVVRAFELLGEGKSYATQKENLKSIPAAYPCIIFGINYDRDTLNNRIEQRVDNMIEQGLVAEVESLLGRGFRDGLTAPQAIGYKEIVQALDGFISLDQAIADIKTATRRYAKRQRSWFKRDKRIVWLEGTGESAETLCARALEEINLREGRG